MCARSWYSVTTKKGYVSTLCQLQVRISFVIKGVAEQEKPISTHIFFFAASVDPLPAIYGNFSSCAFVFPKHFLKIFHLQLCVLFCLVQYSDVLG